MNACALFCSILLEEKEMHVFWFYSFSRHLCGQNTRGFCYLV